MSFVGSLFSNSNGAGYQAAGDSAAQLEQQYNAGQTNLGNAASGYQNLATNGSQLAQQQLAAANAQNIQQNAGLVSSQKGLNPALAARMASGNAAMAGNAAANQSAQLQSQTQMMGLQGLANTGTSQAGLASQTLGAQNSLNENIAAGNQANQASMFGGLLGSAGLSGFKATGATGGPVGMNQIGNNPVMMDMGGPVSSGDGPSSGVGQFLSSPVLPSPDLNKSSGGGGEGESSVASLAPLLLMARGGNVHNLKTGGHVPGKAKVKGDSYANDTVSAKLSPGEVVIPRSVMSSRDPAGQAARFVAAILAKQGGMRK